MPRNNNCITNNLLGMKENEKVKFDSNLNSKYDELPVHEYVKDVIFYFKIFTIIIRIFHVKCLKSVCPMKVNIQGNIYNFFSWYRAPKQEQSTSMHVPGLQRSCYSLLVLTFLFHRKTKLLLGLFL